MSESCHEARAEKWCDVVPKEEWLVSEPRRSELSPSELSFVEAAEYWRYNCNKYYEVLHDVCSCFCVEQDDEIYWDFEYGKAPLTAHGREILRRVMDVLEVKEGDPEYLVWDHSAYDN